jgi:hypothetical protein
MGPWWVNPSFLRRSVHHIWIMFASDASQPCGFDWGMYRICSWIPFLLYLSSSLVTGADPLGKKWDLTQSTSQENREQMDHIQFWLVRWWCRWQWWIWRPILIGCCWLRTYVCTYQDPLLHFLLFYMVVAAIGVVSSAVLVVWLAPVLDARLIFSTFRGSSGVHDGSRYCYPTHIWD